MLVFSQVFEIAIPDPVMPAELIYWARPPSNGKTPHGHQCIYCDRTYARRYQAVYPGGIEPFSAELGKTEKLLEDFKEWRERLIAHIKLFDTTARRG